LRDEASTAGATSISPMASIVSSTGTVRRSVPFSPSQTVTTRSREPLTIVAPSSLTANPRTTETCESRT